MLHPNFVIVGAILNLIGTIGYLVNTIKGRVKPDRVTWLLWSIIPFIAFTAQINQGVGLQSLTTFMGGFGPLLIFAASFVNKKAYWRIGRLDIICGFLSICGLLLWYITKTGNTAIAFSILADGLAAIPTVAKSFHSPQTENYQAYLLAGIAAVITLLTIQKWSFAYTSWSLYTIALCLILVITIKFKLGKLLIKRS